MIDQINPSDDAVAAAVCALAADAERWHEVARHVKRAKTLDAVGVAQYLSSLGFEEAGARLKEAQVCSFAEEGGWLDLLRGP